MQKKEGNHKENRVNTLPSSDESYAAEVTTLFTSTFDAIKSWLGSYFK